MADMQTLRDSLAFSLRLERASMRRARYFHRRASNPLNPNRDAASKVAAGYQRDAAGDRARIAELRSAISEVRRAARACETAAVEFYAHG